MAKYIKYLPYLITLLCIVTVHSTFQKGGAPNPHNYIHLLFPFIIAASYTLEFQEIRWIYKSITYVLISFITLILNVLVVTPWFIEMRYGEAIWYIWEYKETVITNSVYFGGTLVTIYLFMLPLKFFDKSLKE